MSRKRVAGVLGLVVLASFRAFAGDAGNGVPVPIRVDHRGLLEIDGILRMSSESKWGASNLVVKPFGGWSAQDYCLKDIKKTGDTLTARFNTNPALKMVEVVKHSKDKGRAWTEVRYTLTPEEGGLAKYEKVYAFLPVATADFAGGKAILDDGTEITLPTEPAGDVIALPQATKSLTLVSNNQIRLTVKSSDLAISLHDMRPKTTAFQIWLEHPSPANKPSLQVEFEVSAERPPHEIRADGQTWIELPYARAIQDGGILDFSFLCDAPAGKDGRIVNKDGHFAYEATGERVKLIGTNLCYTANYLEKPEADRLAAYFRKMGYNTIRFHHTDVHIRKDNWKSKQSDDIDPEYLDRLDYMFAAMKNAGMYVTIDLYTQRTFGKGEIEGIDREISGEIKGLVPIHEPAFEAWKKLVVKWMNHVNPYTGLTWKDDPALLSICPLNEDSIACSWGGVAKPFYLQRFDAWKRERNLTSLEADPGKDPLFMRFLIEVKMESNRKIEQFLRDLGVKAMLTGSNWWDTMAQTFMRDQFDLVDNHQYADHPQPHWLPSRYNQGTNLKGHYTYIVPIMKASSRIFGKPFTVSEYNYCAPNKHRAEGGALMGAYAALQDWDGLYRFAWAHDEKRVYDVRSMHGFDMSSDPLNQLTERQVVLLYRRGDVSPAQKKLVYGVTMADATRQGVGDMWGRGLFPHEFNAQALVSQTGSAVIEGDRQITGSFEGVVTREVPAGADVVGGNPALVVKDLPKLGKEVRSDTGEILLNSDKGFLQVQTPATECVVAPAGIDLNVGSLAIAGSDTFCSVSASAMDGKPLDASGRVLLFHLTNVLNEGIRFASKDMTTLVGWGELPYIAQAGRVRVTLRNSVPGMKLFACDFGGSRLKEIAATYADGAYAFVAEVSATNPVMVYELALP